MVQNRKTEKVSGVGVQETIDRKKNKALLMCNACQRRWLVWITGESRAERKIRNR